ncbi:hypothetical protein [Gordonia cholesterolivorans]|uniref:J domain-containing protein n=1 Tax=Gordonia cholesterolivorans TaxID=559625 RepID=A0ABN3HCA7_9ACTN
MPAHIDLYRAHGLDRHGSCMQLAQQLKAQLKGADPRDTVTRGRIEVARDILGGKKSRESYDRHLADPGAPTITEPVLAGMAAKAKKSRSSWEWAAAIGGAIGWFAG